MSRILVSVGFWILVAAGLTPGRAQQILDEETSRDDGALDLWCNGQKLGRYNIRKRLNLEKFPNRIISFVTFLPADHIGWEKPLYAYRFELDADQVEAVRLQVKPKRRGRPPKEVDAAAIKAAKERRRAEKKPHTQAKLAEDFGVSKSTIRRRQ